MGSSFPATEFSRGRSETCHMSTSLAGMAP
nr:MAG TPA: hypothetical protein [Caudoviricetes sp.]DAY81227.1 MAG TPA: hypothetical protein [Caudoviricetes sp.]